MLQVTECPSDVKLVTRVATVNEDDVTIGSSIECDLILTTTEPTEDSIWATVFSDKEKGEYVLKPHGDDTLINGRPVVSGSSKALADGDIVQLSQYTILFSCQQSASAKPVEVAVEHHDVEFDANNILSGLGDKPEETKASFSQRVDDSYLEYDEIANADRHEQMVGTPIDELADKIDHLVEITQNPWIQQKKLLSMLDGVVDEFIKEFDPALIEDMVGNPGFFGNGKNWEAYKKYYKRKCDEGQFKRQFKALLIECLQK